MGDSTIEWTNKTWNPVTGCSKVSEGCDHCYAETLALGRLKGQRGYPGLPWSPENAAENVVLRPERLSQPRSLRKPHMIFVNSMSDLFHPRIPGEFIAEIFAVMADCPQHTFQVLTKRPKRMASWARKYRPEPLPNVWLGTSIESREHVHRAVALGDAPAAVRFISAEPLLGPLIPEAHSVTIDGDDVLEETTWLDGYIGPGLRFYNIDGELAFHWLIAGGESGQGHRPIDAEWVRDLRDVCEHEGVAFFFKQWGGIRPKSGGRELDGRTWDEYPTRVGVPA